MKKYLLVGFVLSLAVVSCKNPEDDLKTVEFANSCEKNQLWINEESVHEIGQAAHSGLNCVGMDYNTVYGLGINLPYAKAADGKKIKKIKVKFWLRTDIIPLEAAFITSIESDSVMFMDNFSFNDKVQKHNEWTLVEYEVNVPEKDYSNCFVKCYFLNEKRLNYWADDLSIQFETSN